MGKATPPKKATKAAPTADVHARIAEEARALKAAENMGFQDTAKTPALQELLESATHAINAAIPSTFEHMGRTYYLRVSIGVARVMVFETGAAPEPMTYALTGSYEEYGHLPFH